MKKILVLILLVGFSFCVSATVTLPKIFGDNMVLQRDKPIQIWGWAKANEKVTVNFHEQTKTTKTSKTGKWQIVLEPEIAGGPFKLLVQGRNKLTINNVLVGEVWLCSGQSNMEMPIAGWGKINNYEQEISAADFPQIRQFDVPNTTSISLNSDVAGGDWKICSPQTAGEFSATAYFFARELYQELKVPIGLINSTWGGTQSESWTSQEAFENSEYFKEIGTMMKSGDMASNIQKAYEIKVKNIEKLIGNLDTPPNVAHWMDEDFNDANWPQMKVPGVWESQGLIGLDGVVWFRKTIEITASDADKTAVIELSKIDDQDETYINGIKIGGMSKWDDIRKYNIPAGILKAGKNTIAVRVQDDGGGGGFYGDSADIKLTTGNNSISLTGDWKFKVESVLKQSSSIGPNDYLSLLFNAMIFPLIPYTLEGVIWYQGEANESRAFEYRKAFPLMIQDWRKHWNEPNLPFFFVQLSTYGPANANSNTGSPWAELRESQTATLSLPNTGMIVTTDIGNPVDIHPKNKQEVGRRLAALALHDVYHQEGEYTGPMYQSFKIEGNKIVLSFSHTGNGWFVNDKYGYIKGFEISGDDQKFYPAKAMIAGDKIIVYQESVEHPLAVRYNWADDASEGNLFNDKKYPAAPFRTDYWKTITGNKKYSILN